HQGGPCLGTVQQEREKDGEETDSEGMRSVRHGGVLLPVRRSWTGDASSYRTGASMAHKKTAFRTGQPRPQQETHGHPIRLISSCQLPALAVVAAEELLRLGGVANPHRPGVPLQTLAGAVGDVAEVVRLGQQTTVAEMTRRRRAGLAGPQPFGVMTDRFGNRLSRIFEPREILLR